MPSKDDLAAMLAPEFIHLQRYRQVLKVDLVMCTHEQAFKNNAFQDVVTKHSKVEDDLNNLIASPLTTKAEKAVFRRLKSTLPSATSKEVITDRNEILKYLKLGNEYEDLFANDMKLRGTHDEYYATHGMDHFCPEDGTGAQITKTEIGPGGIVREKVIRKGYSATDAKPTEENRRRLRAQDVMVVSDVSDQTAAPTSTSNSANHPTPDFGFGQAFDDNLRGFMWTVEK